MIGRSHAVSGVAGWVSACAALSLAGYEPARSTVLIGAGVAAGFALLPDVDHPGSTVAWSLGPLTGGVARVVSWVADWVQDRTCRCCTDPDRVAHRTLTHTGVGAVVTGAVVAWCGFRLGKPAAAVVLGLAVALAVLGVGRGRRRGLAALAAGGAAAALLAELGPVGGWWWLGVPAGFGVLAHIVGDGLTKSAVPVLWPLKIRGCRWYRVGSPPWLRFRTGGGVERFLVGPLMLAVLAGSCWVLVG